MTRFQIPLRLLAAFLGGWLVAFLNVLGYIVDAFGVSVSTALPLLALLLPPGLGIVAAILTISQRNKRSIRLTLLTGMLVIAGWYVYWLPQMMRTDEEDRCVNCSPHGYGISNTGGLVYIWVIDTVLFLVSALVSFLIIKAIRKLCQMGLRVREQRRYQTSVRTLDDSELPSRD